jgi:DNA topoisomerase-1
MLEIKSEIDGELRDALPALRPEEAAVLALLRGRLERETEARLTSQSAAGRKLLKERLSVSRSPAFSPSPSPMIELS